MKRALQFAIALFVLSLQAWGTIAAVGGATNTSSTSVTTLTVTYSATAGNALLCYLALNSTASAPSAKDNNSNALTAGPTKTNGGAAGEQSSFYMPSVFSGTTSIVFKWTSSSAVSAACEEYSGVAAINASMAGNTGSGAAGTAQISLTTQDANDYVVMGVGAAATTWTANTGTLRQNTIGVADRVAIVDNTAATASNVLCAVTVTTVWDATAIELRSTAGAASSHLDKRRKLARLLTLN